MTSEDLKAFNINHEPADIRETYGDNGFGQGVFLARRLVENNVRFVEVQLGGWTLIPPLPPSRIAPLGRPRPFCTYR